jgi:membrane-associated phospholipid phosphatase
MTAFVAAGRRFLPRGWRDFGLQLVIWFGFLVAYQLARGLADRNPKLAFENGLTVIHIERHASALFELTVQRIIDSSGLLRLAASWTYWSSEFVILGIGLLWVYLRRNDAFIRFRNTVLIANLIGLVGYIAVPTAPPRMFQGAGFVDTLQDVASVNHGSSLITFISNPYAAMPSLHAADALIVGITLAALCRRRIAKAFWLIYPAWVWVAVIGTGNHFWLDVVAGILVALLAAGISYRRYLRPIASQAAA